MLQMNYTICVFLWSCNIVPPKPAHLQTPVIELCRPLGRSSPFNSKMEEGGGGGGKGRVSDLISRFEENRYTCKVEDNRTPTGFSAWVHPGIFAASGKLLDKHNDLSA